MKKYSKNIYRFIGIIIVVSGIIQFSSNKALGLSFIMLGIWFLGISIAK